MLAFACFQVNAAKAAEAAVARTEEMEELRLLEQSWRKEADERREALMAELNRAKLRMAEQTRQRVQAEANAARERETLFPISIEDCQLPLPFTMRNTLDVFWMHDEGRFVGIDAVHEHLAVMRNTMGAAGKLVDDRTLSIHSAKVIASEVMRRFSLDEIEAKATADDATAIWLWGAMQQGCLGVAKDQEAGAELLERAANAGLQRARHSLGNAYVFGFGVPKDVEKGLALINGAAEAGVAVAQVWMGIELQRGRHLEKNEAAAFRWLHRAAVAGSPEAQDHVASAYYDGLGTAKDPREAIYWYQKAATAGLPVAQAMLGAIYADGRIVPPDLEQAAGHYKAAFRSGHLQSALCLGRLYEHAAQLGDQERAIEWYQRAGKNDLYEGYYNAARLYRRFASSVKMTLDVRYQLAFAADQGNMPALVELGEVYENGEFGEVDLDAALEAYAIAIQSGRLELALQQRAEAGHKRIFLAKQIGPGPKTNDGMFHRFFNRGRPT